ncbi:MAG TPA: hypothetical protein VIL30_20800 [Ramlibacter sp.]|jgi:rubrerythrin
MKPSRAELIAALSELKERELVEAIYEVLKARNVDRQFPGGEFEYDRWCLAQATFGKFGKVDAEAHIELAALPVPGCEPSNVTSLHEQGRCTRCGSAVTSSSKRAVCPVCSTEVECT